MFKKKKTETIKNIFTISSEEAKSYLASIIRDVKTIMENEKFIEFTKRVKVPENATTKEFEQLVNKVVRNKVYNFLMVFIDDCYDEVRRILSAIFVTDFEEYKKKSLEYMCKDISTLSKTELGKVLGFFRY